MDDKMFEKIQEVYSSICALHPHVTIGDEKEERLHFALHDLNAHMEEIGCKKFKLNPETKVSKN